MQYTAYLEKILGNKTKIALLRVFYKIPDKIWTSRELARYIGMYNTTILDNFDDFVDFGLLEVGMHGKGKTIKVNKESFVFRRIVKPLFGTEKNTFEELLSSLKSLIKPKEIKLLALFGSIVEHKEKPNSDIDLLIVTENKETIEKQILKKQAAISKQFGNELSPYIFTPQEFKRKQNSPFLRDAKKKCLILYGDWNENSSSQ